MQKDFELSSAIGIDEAGRGCLAGPVVASAVLLPDSGRVEDDLPGLNDSKRLSQQKRESLSPLIKEYACAYGIGIAWQDEIDRINILNATFRAMARAVFALAAQSSFSLQALPALVIDGNHKIPLPQWVAALPEPRSEYASFWEHTANPLEFYPLPEQIALVGGDGLHPSISAASIIAKTARDRLMKQVGTAYPEYGFEEHKGYGTKQHLKALQRLGPCPLHRMTFRKVRQKEEQLTLFGG